VVITTGNVPTNTTGSPVELATDIIGRWQCARSGEIIEFFVDGSLETVILGGIVVNGRYFFDDNEIVIRLPVLGIETENRTKNVFMESANNLLLDGTHYTRIR
jgi:hypothetical protein